MFKKIVCSIPKLFLADAFQRAKIDEAIADMRTLKFFYFPMTKFFGKPESAEGLKEVTDSMEALEKLCFSVSIWLT